MHPITAIDLSVLDWIQAHLQSEAADRFFSQITHLADGGAIWIALAVLFLFLPKTRPLGLALALALLLDLVLCNLLLKPLIARTRPFVLQPWVVLLIPSPEDFSFPSGHTAASFAAAFALLFSRSRHWLWAMPLAAIIAFSRLYLYVHYPTDILGGILVGLAAGWLGCQLCRKWYCAGLLSRFFSNENPKNVNHL